MRRLGVSRDERCYSTEVSMGSRPVLYFEITALEISAGVLVISVVFVGRAVLCCVSGWVVTMAPMTSEAPSKNQDDIRFLNSTPGPRYDDSQYVGHLPVSAWS